MIEPSLYWHDYETWGGNPAIDRPCQFAGLRTNLNLEPIAEPDVWYCKPTIDILPHPEAILITGITPAEAMAKGLSEPEFMANIAHEMGQPNTCSLGYNTLRFDDEVTRFGFYRNFYDPYAREWQNNNSRWDLIDVVRACYALRPEGIRWPMIDGRPSFKLEYLAIENNLLHSRAHDALSDVEVTIALARLIKEKQPRLYDHLFNLRLKNNVSTEIDVFRQKPFLHISSKFSALNGCAALVAPIVFHPTNKNAVLVFNLSQDPEPLIHLSVEEIAQRVFTANDNLPEGVERLALKAVHINKCPVVLTPKLLTADNALRLNIDTQQCEKHWHKLLAMNVAEKVSEAFALTQFAAHEDAEQQLYDGFLSPKDKPLFELVRKASAVELASQAYHFNDQRYNHLLLRYKARHFPASLSEAERIQWQEILQQRWLEGVSGYLTLDEFYACIETLQSQGLDSTQASSLISTQEWVTQEVEKISLDTP
ncbi:MAG: exodeoxyribonuclease I [Marinagarivorans sp.]|nr:exodeoxyribonuclease I [Marinagarivorans sp.]